jgi:CelD/BcsL family acetyltransferase involved in cellulose biosynthesis
LKIREVNDFSHLKEEWDILLKMSLFGDNVFLTWEWLSTWWKHFSEGRKLLLLTVEDGEKNIAIAPLVLSKYKLPFFGSVKKIEFLGVKHSDYNNFIVSEKERECLKLIINYLMDTTADWDWIELKEIPETFENPAIFENLFSEVSPDLKLKKRVYNICPYISLPSSFNLLMKRLSKNMRQNLNKYLRRIKKEHRVKLKRYDEAGFSVQEGMEIFLELHSKRWASKGLPGSFSKEPAFLDFHMDVAECFADKGWLGLYFLTADDEPVAVQYNFEYAGKMYYYLGGFDPQFSNYSVGNLLTMFVLDRCIRRGFREYDMMRGDEPYKLYWTRTFRRNFEVRLVRSELTKKFHDWLTWSDAVNSLVGKLKLSLQRDYANRFFKRRFR